MEYFFCSKYVMRFTEEEGAGAKIRVDNILRNEVSSIAETTAEDLAFERCRRRQDTDAMMFDKWQLSVWPAEGTSYTMIKPYCADVVTVRAINTDTDALDTFEIDVLEAVQILEDLQRFLSRSDLVAGTKRAADGPAEGDESVRNVSPRLESPHFGVENGN
jgi:hypothetical protein